MDIRPGADAKMSSGFSSMSGGLVCIRSVRFGMVSHFEIESLKF